MTGESSALERTATDVRGADGAELLFDAAGEIVAASDSCVVVFEREPGELVGETVASLTAAGYFNSEPSETADGAPTAFRGTPDGGQRTVTVAVRPGVSDERLLYRATLDPVRAESEVVGTRWSLSAVGTRERYEETLEALHQATRDLVGAGSELAVYDRIGTAANDILGVPGTGVRKYDAEAEVLRHVAFGNPVTNIDTRPPYDVDASPHGRAFRKGSTVVEEIEDDDPYDREVFTHVMYVPIGEYGVLSLGRVGGPFADTDQRFAEILAENGATALDEVRHRERLEAQRRDLKRYETIVETVPDPVYATDADGRVTFVNEAFEAYFGYDRDELAGLHAGELATGDGADTITSWLDGATDRASTEPLSVEVDARSHDDRRRRFEASMAPLPSDESFAGAAGVFRDITDRTRRQTVLSVINRALRHNLRTNANTITVYANVLADGPTEDPEEYADYITSAANWLVKLADTLRTLQTTLTGSPKDDVESAVLVDRAVSRYREEYPSAAIDTGEIREGRLPGGPALQFALDNVVENAVVHNDAPEPSVTVSVEPADRDGWVDVRVTDNGPGIPPEERSVVLGEAEITQLTHGSGIGLWVTRWVVQAFDGEVAIADNDPRGSVVTLTLPCLDTD